MRPRRTPNSNCVFRLEGGTEDNDLWLQRATDSDGDPVLCSCWVPTDVERQQIGEGANVELVLWGTGHPPVAMRVVTYQIGAKETT